MADNENNNADVQNVNQTRERIFLLDNLDLFEEKEGVSVFICLTKVPSGCVLVHRGPFQEKFTTYKVVGPGLHKIKPFSQRKLYVDRDVPLQADVAPFDCDDSNNWTIHNVDFSLRIRLSNPAKFSYNDNVERSDQRVLYVLNDTFCSVVKKFVRGKSWDEVKSIFTGVVNKSVLDVDRSLSAFESQSGIEIVEVHLEGMTPPAEAKEMAAANQQSDIARVDNARKIAQAKAQAQSDFLIAEAKAKGEELSAAAQAKGAKQLIKAGVSSHAVDKKIEYSSLPQGANVFVNTGDNSNSYGSSNIVRDAMLLKQVFGNNNGGNMGGQVGNSNPSQNSNAVPSSPVVISPRIQEIKDILQQGLTVFPPDSLEYHECEVNLDLLNNDRNTLIYLSTTPGKLDSFIDDFKAKIANYRNGRGRTR